MCRFLAYRGAPMFLEALVSAPCHSLIHQSMHAEEAKVPTNGDGFGLGWYGDRDEPGLYRELRPAWSDENLLSLARLVRSHLFFAHVRASTGTATARSNCHPFAVGRWMFMHNGQIGGWPVIRRAFEALIPDALYPARAGTTDSEALFLRALALIADGATPLDALGGAISDAKRLMARAGVEEALRFTAVLTDGADLYAVRWACDGKPPTLYLCDREDALIIASEPLDAARECWRALPAGGALVAMRGHPIQVIAQQDGWARAA